MNYNTQYYKNIIEIWQNSTSRDEAHATIQQKVDKDLTYKGMMYRLGYARSCGVAVKYIEPIDETIDFELLRESFGDRFGDKD